METFIGGILLISILVAVHEMGHLLIARDCGVGVESFSIGFGPGFMMFIWRGIPFYLRCIPLGGYVKLRQRNMPNSVSDGKCLEDATWRQKILIFAAGAGFNLFLAVVIRTLMFWFAPAGTEARIFWFKVSFVPLLGPWYFAPFLAIKTTFIAFAAYFVNAFLGIWFAIMPLIKTSPIAHGGVIGMIGLGANAHAGFWSFCGLVYYCSVLLAAVNLLPLIPFDGGHIATTLTERIFGQGRFSRIFCGAIKWFGVVLIIILLINIVLSDLFDILRYIYER